MASIERINLSNSSVRMNLKRTLGYAVRKRNGYYDDIRYIDNNCGKTVESMAMAGFIHTGNTLKHETYSITSLGDQYYSDVFGKLSYLKQRFLGKLDEYKQKIFKREV